jgi:lariat debranching enzyme
VDLSIIPKLISAGQVIDYELSNEQLSPDSPHSLPVLSFDPEWLAISRAFHPWLSTSKFQRPFPVEEEARKMIEQELEWVSKNVPRKLDSIFLISECQTFVPTAPGPGPGHEGTANQQRV